MATPSEILKRYWGHDSFRPNQSEIIDSVMAGHDTLALMPTGGGKSLCYQIPALLLDGMTLVVSPLIALMKDQVQQLTNHHIKAACLTSELNSKEQDIVLNNCLYGDIKMLYVSPERLKQRVFIEHFRRMKISLIAVDEAHCVSQWGHDFRPAYLDIASIRQYHPTAPLLALTASATPTVVADIRRILLFSKDSNTFANSFYRPNLAYMFKMKQEAEGRVIFTREKLMEYGAGVKLFPGVSEWFERIRAYGSSKEVAVEHYIISSGLKEMIEGTSPAKAGAFEQIFASSFYYNDRGVAVWPAQAVNYTNKTQFLFRISKGVLDVNDVGVNEYFAPEDIRVPFRNIVYIGDSDTDIPCMKLVNSYGGHSIGVYNCETGDKRKVHKMLKDNRIRYFAAADYREGTEIDTLVKAIIDRTAANEALEKIYLKCREEL